MYIPRWDPMVFRISMHSRNFGKLTWASRQYAVENKFKMYKHKFERA